MQAISQVREDCMQKTFGTRLIFLWDARHAREMVTRCGAVQVGTVADCEPVGLPLDATLS